MSLKLSVPDLKLLNFVLECGHRLEREWPYSVEARGRDELKEFCRRIENLKQAQSEELKRLTSTVEHLSEKMTARHLAGYLVAFERLNNKAMRDDEFLVVEGDLEKPASPPEPVIVIADNIRSAFNVGAIFRTAECFNLQEVVLTGYTATPDDEKTARTSMGAAEHLPWRSVRETSMAVIEAKLRGFTVIALETVSTATSLDNFKWPEKCAILIGNERFGVDREALAQADHIVKIPLRGRKNSLNVGISLGIALHSRFQKAVSARDAADARHGTDARDAADACHVTESSAVRTTDKWELTPIGFFRSESIHPYEAPRQATQDQSALEGVIELNSNFPIRRPKVEDFSEADELHPFLPKLQSLEQGLADLDGFDRIWLIYRFHHNANWKPMVLPPRGPQIKRGVFATRAPYRPNAIGMSCVELVKIEGRKIYVRGFDLLDQTPIYDIKPYLAYADSHPEAALGWLEGLDESANQLRFSPSAEGQLDWLEANGVSQLRGFIQAQLRFDPLDSQRKRVTSSAVEGMHEIAYRTWRVSFYFDSELKTISILSIYSGYSDDDLIIAGDHDLPTRDLESSNGGAKHTEHAKESDPHGDKKIHRAFLKQF